MIKVFRSFYAKLSLLFLVLILCLGAGSIIIAFTAAGHLFDEVEQLLNREYAESIAAELRPMVKEGFSKEMVKDAIHYMMVLNPMVEIYLLDGSGMIKAYFVYPEEQLIRERIDLGPVRQFIANEGYGPVPGDDPRTSEKTKPFSAAPLAMGGSEGYVYVILRGEQYDRSFAMLRSSYYLRTGFSTFIFAILATILAGLSLFFFLTRRLRRLSSAVKAFETGDYTYRLNIQGSDEISALGKAFNRMAASIQSGVNKLRQVEEQRGNLITNISHDLRSPLTSIRGYLETMQLKENSLTAGERRDFLGIILGNVSSLQQLVEELFELVNLESGQTRPEFIPFHIDELAQDVLLKFLGRAEKSGVTISMDRPSGLTSVNGDIGMIERVFTNLLENALAYTPAGGGITISIRIDAGAVTVSISDTGSGITTRDLPHVFERFYRADKSRDRGTPGTGLGLAIVKEILELHGGSIRAESPDGSGAVFHFTLPVAAEPKK